MSDEERRLRKAYDGLARDYMGRGHEIGRLKGDNSVLQDRVDELEERLMGFADGLGTIKMAMIQAVQTDATPSPWDAKSCGAESEG